MLPEPQVCNAASCQGLFGTDVHFVFVSPFRRSQFDLETNVTLYCRLALLRVVAAMKWTVGSAMVAMTSAQGQSDPVTGYHTVHKITPKYNRPIYYSD